MSEPATVDSPLIGCALQSWDLVVIGAGPAGALAARQAAAAGLVVLLLDAKYFPRSKACGGCLNSRAISVLDGVGLGHVLDRSRSAPIQAIELRRSNRIARLPLPSGRAIGRREFDQALADAAVAAGATFLDGTQALVESSSESNWRSISVVRGSVRSTLRAHVVICADGLTRSSVRRLAGHGSKVAMNSRIGIGATLPGGDITIPPHLITMIVARHGYVGLADCGSNRVNVAAALDADVLARMTPSDFVCATLLAAGVRAPSDWQTANWHGTPPLTSRPTHVAAERLFLIGDAGGYVEPFSGEGMAAALQSAVAVVPLVIRAARDWSPAMMGEWTSIHRELVWQRQATCRRLAWMLRRPWAASAAVNVCRWYPRLADQVIAKVN